MRLTADQARLMPRFRDRAQQEFERAGKAGVDTAAPRWKTPAGDDQQRLRGLPCIAREVTGAQPGSDPVLELLRKEARRERRR
jgi:hypothetical protein